ncbi:DEAD/DEAH box helicase [Altericroceibacterium spongiae]|uniref:DEAD-box ATP-dependent RNA helicase RhpA n=1 Tax=Altericroceibacterium spongiae TaxID=2320269 RepID=A0A420EEX0_9SPHN|nr:DEAD/DEAH box helicase [Altericroceibacterium spongiae]RKF19222.1 DEAD/DEAH box helicase [Altericroceibacterium spongiae]
MKFADLGLSDKLLQAVEAAGYTEPTPIQAQAIPQVQMMKDLIAIAQTGTGKTASFVLPMIDILDQGRKRARMPRSLILAPTRELAVQVADNFEQYGKNHSLSMALLIGGVQMGDQVKALDEGVDVLIATPGRLMDLFERGKILLTGCELLVIDEADRMLDMGFIPDIESICEKLPASRQTLLFSATMPPPIKKLADRFLTNPKYIEVARPATANINIAQHQVKVIPRKKREVLRYLLRNDDVQTAIIFANRKTTVRELAKSLKRSGFAVGEIHGDMDQSSRMAELALFKGGEINILVASDVAARGIDIKGVSHVFNFDTPWHPDDYVHRIGRTGRAGAKGRAFTFVTDADAEAVANIEKLTGMKIPEWEFEEAATSKKGAAADKASVQDSTEAAPKRSSTRRKSTKDVEEKSRKTASAARSNTSRRKSRAQEEDNQDIAGEWHGPIPEFLSISAIP